MDSGRNGGGGRGAGRAGKKGASAATSAAAPGWKKPSGANLSAKAKKEYLKWKREQKRNQTDDTDSDWELEGAGGGGEGEGGSQHQGPAAAAVATAAAALAAGQGRRTGGRTQAASAVAAGPADRRQQCERAGRDEEVGERPPRPGRRHPDPERPGRQQAPPASDGDEDEGDEEEEGGEEAAPHPPHPQPQAIFRHGPAAQAPGGGAKGQVRVRAAPDDRPLCFVPLVDMPRGDVPEIVRAACGVESMRLPRVREDEVGFTEEGRGLGMPKRPAWRGVVRNADQLHRLEERSFQAWMDRLYGSVDSPSRISFFEPKLDFWRQLWRVLERSDVAVMIVDARNPLLHFSEALARHVLDEHGISALLVLNKCDLVPRAAVAEWRAFFEGRYPGLKVVASSAAASGGAGAAEAIMDAVLDCDISRDGRRVKVAQVVGMSRDEVLAASKARNTHSKRDRPQPPPPQQHQHQHGQSRGRGAASGGEEPEAGDADVGTLGRGAGGGGSEADGDEDWTLQGTKAKKKLAVRRKRNQRMHAAATTTTNNVGGSGGGGGGDGDGDGAGGRAASKDRNRSGSRGRAVPGGGGSAPSCPRKSVHEGTTEELEEGGGATTEAEAEVEADEEGDGEDGDNDNAAFDDLADEEDRKDFLGSGQGEEEEEEMGEEEEEEEEEEERRAGAEAAAATAGGTARAAGWGGHGARGGRDRRGRSRPVVVCVVGEPNVGKSSTMNALLGAKRVAVSSHPGRTKHYQTHVMCPSLMLCDCPGLVFPRLDVSLHMQVLFGSYPIARCRDPYAVVRYLAERVWPRLHVTLGLKPVLDEDDDDGDQEGRDEDWTPLALCEALAARHNWRSRRGGRLDVYRAANWILRSALAGRNGVDVAFLPPQATHQA